MSKRILVTGGAGFLGSHLSDRLIKEGNEVLCLDNFFTGSRKNIHHLLDHKNFELIRHDVTFPTYLEVDEIYNLACPASPVHYQFDWTATSGSILNPSIVGGSSYFIGTYNGGGNEFITDIYQKRLSGAPGVTMSVSLGGDYYNIAASFTGSNYRISGSYIRIPS
jgi:dTDP-D-glucose 4,6-dehydratase